MLKPTLEAIENNFFAALLLTFAILCLGGIAAGAATSIWQSAAKSVCFAHHAASECDPSLRASDPEVEARIKDRYLDCLGKATVEICNRAYYNR